MRFFGPKHTFEDVVRELIEGLENGTITLDEPDEEAGEPVEPLTSEEIAAEGRGPLFMASTVGLAALATVAAVGALLLVPDPPRWAFVAACFGACAACAAAAFWLGVWATSLPVPSTPNLPTRAPERADDPPAPSA